VALLLSFGYRSHAVTLAWDASVCNDCTVDGYKIYWGAVQGDYTSVEDVGDVLQVEVDIPYDSYIVATAYNADGESGYSNWIFYSEQADTIQPSMGGMIFTLFLNESSTNVLGKDYEMVWENGKIIIIFDQLNAGDTVKLNIK